jgi:hypothetical protein
LADTWLGHRAAGGANELSNTKGRTMTTDAKLPVRACCRAGRERGRGYVAGEGGACLMYGYGGALGPVIEEIEPPAVDERISWHEAGHAVLGHGLGRQIDSVSAAPPACVVWAAGGYPPWQSAIINLAGPAAEGAARRFYFREHREVIADYCQRAIAFEGGGCDGCQAALCCWAIVGANARQGGAIAMWRAAEEAAEKLVRLQHVRRAVSRLADELMHRHCMPGSEAADLVDPIVAHGSLVAAVPQPQHRDKEC